MKCLAALALTASFALFLALSYLIHVWYLPVSVVFYGALLDSLAAAIGMTAVLWLFRGAIPLSLFEATLLLIIWLLLGYSFAISIPTVLDRSLSFYILEKLQQRGGGIRKSRMQDMFVNEYIPEFRLIDVRLTEQLASGTIIIKNDCVILTPWGRIMATLSRFFRMNFLPKHRLLGEEYTDVLVDPFKNSAQGKIGYECNGAH
jgi:hypothetical protein